MASSLISGLNSFLINLQSGNGSGSTGGATATGDTAAATAGTSTDATSATGSTSGASQLLAELQDLTSNLLGGSADPSGSAEGTRTGAPTGSGGSTGTAAASGTAGTTGGNDLMQQVMAAMQAYGSQINNGPQAGTSLSA